jgi:hypothetical protein
MTNLPIDVVERDRTLQKATDDLAKLRWHWTLDESNPDRVSFREYARQVGVAWNSISYMANGYAEFIKSDVHGTAHTPGQPQTVSDHIELAKMGGERQDAVKAIAKATGASVTNVASNKREEVDAVLSTARERALDRGTTVQHETERAAEWRAKARKAAERETDERKARSTMRFVEIEGHIGAAMQRLRKVLEAAEGVQFADEEKELVVESLAKLRALLNLIDMRIAGETSIDWDAELERLVN